MNKFYTVNCSTTRSEPDLVFVINGIKYSVPPEEYVLDIGVGGGQCSLPSSRLPSGQMKMDWILGEAWTRTYCNIYDFGHKRIGFAKAIRSKSWNHDFQFTC
ncbi:Inositol hexakisphosphate and diphosphoinositol-pentakisphosphate kinase [Parelaphostrongylus tenuis]|uniref:Inositol hexakisphosphate and diphosphoinositol-pentakisphosphate kinase n=1 Tax=Parelaphostrongylus tenuis TaxID=148309 RepID=A0AAD5WKR4_PARTN|nr:Inositol hexakisphosphate and diphosphoinositol-pentakisphosphate kinase [Parelaphostrongylus tenuis]